jgi:hypothetical protein
MAIIKKKYGGRNLRPNFRWLCHETAENLRLAEGKPTEICGFWYLLQYFWTVPLYKYSYLISGLTPLRNVRICGLRIIQKKICMPTFDHHLAGKKTA